MIGTGNEARRETKRTRRRRRIRPAYILLLVVMAFFAYKFLQKTQEVRRLAQQEAGMRDQNNRLAARNARIRSQIQYYKTPQYVEDTARAILGLTKPGETAIQLVPAHRSLARVGPAPARPALPPEPAWKQWWHAFFG